MKLLARAAAVAVFTIAALLSFASTLMGCAAVAAAVPTITTVVAIVTAIEPVIAQVAAFVRSYFAQHPDAALKQGIEDKIAKVALAAQGIAALGQLGIDVDQNKLAAALADFQTAYADLLAEIGKLPGVQVANPGSASALRAPAGVRVLVVPPPSAFSVAAVKK